MSDLTPTEPGKVAFLCFPQEIPQVAAIARHLLTLGYVSHLWTVDALDLEAGKRTGAFTNVINLLAGFDRNGCSEQYERSLRSLQEFEDHWGSSFFHADAALDRGLLGHTGPETDLSHFFIKDRWKWEQVVVMGAQLLESTQAALQQDAPIAVVGELNKIWNRLVFRCATKAGTSYLYPVALRSAYRFHFVASLTYEWPECIGTYRDMLDGGIPEDAKKVATRELMEIRVKGTKAAYSEGSSQVRRPLRHKLRPTDIAAGLRTWREAASAEAGNSPSRPSAELLNPSNKIRRAAEAVSRDRFYRSVTRHDLPQQPYISYFLHLQPEWTVESLAFEYQDQAATIRNIVACLPVGCVLVVKEHPHVAGRRSQAFYGEVASLTSVHLLHHSVDSFSVALRSLAVISLTGMIAFEAMCLGIPSIVLGHVYFSDFRGVTRAESLYRLQGLLQHPDRLERATDDDALCALAAIYRASYPAAYPGEPANEYNNQAIARAIAAELRKAAPLLDSEAH